MNDSAAVKERRSGGVGAAQQEVGVCVCVKKYICVCW